MGKVDKEGESYLDNLLNTVAPDWEDTSSQPEGQETNNSDNGIAFEDAIAMLNDLPDEDDVKLSDNPEEDMAELFGMLQELGVDPSTPMQKEEAVEMPDVSFEIAGEVELGEEPEGIDFGEENAVSEDVDLSEMPEEIELPEMTEEFDLPEMSEIPEDMEATEAMSEAEMVALDTEEPEEMEEQPFSIEDFSAEDILGEAIQEDMSQEEAQADMTPEELEAFGMEADFALEEYDIQPEENAEYSESQSTEEDVQISAESVAMDDIFQDALSAVAYSGNEEDEYSEADVFSLDDVADLLGENEEDITSVPVANPMEENVGKEKKPGFLKKVFGNIITDTTADEEEAARQKEEENRAKKAAEKEEKKKQAEVSKEEKAQLAQEAKERKQQLKAEKAAVKQEKKEEKKRLKAEREAEAAQEVVGKINPIGATIVIIFFATIGIATVFGSQLLERRSSLSDAENYFANEDYIRAYDEISSVDLKEDDEELYQRIRICSQIQKQMKSYENYTSMNMNLEALDSLVKGIAFYDSNKAEAARLAISPAFEKLKTQIVTSLGDNYGISESEAREMLALPEQEAYTLRLQQIVAE